MTSPPRTDDRPTRSRRSVLAALAGLGLAGTVPAGATAQSDADGDTDPFAAFSDEDDGDVDWSEIAEAALDRVQYSVSTRTGFADPPTASDQATALRSEIDDHSGTYAAYSHVPTDVTLTEFDVLEVATSGPEETATFYVDAAVSDGRIDSITTTSSTDRAVDYRLALSAYASAQAPGELRHFREQYVEPDDPIDATLRSRWAGKFGGRLGGSHIAVEEVN